MRLLELNGLWLGLCLLWLLLLLLCLLLWLCQCLWLCLRLYLWLSDKGSAAIDGDLLDSASSMKG